MELELTFHGSDPQLEFWRSRAKFRAFIGGVGSGKTKAGVSEILRPEYVGTMGAVIAPTFPMLRDATLRTFLTTCERLAEDQGWQVLKQFHRGDMVAELVGGTRVLFRSADDPERLRGPNLGFFT